ncbi:hypothetical protein BDK51DRAFT_38205 [Blyttiomyces helicus]|uniref:Uncharacterized protein n=1 Tax=Blyttiomyces helicus TaxID=388810 RepID=A0A4P9W815_9FUNG|nr:hypothetical protein BDK51DRAFT_38205 [Blyttiomyces helicus]|eukprot:RKO87555.1 hypothetical protein BDK51DRAFT_38205 [Blyttiomyces helicus]
MDPKSERRQSWFPPVLNGQRVSASPPLSCFHGRRVSALVGSIYNIERRQHPPPSTNPDHPIRPAAPSATPPIATMLLLPTSPAHPSIRGKSPLTTPPSSKRPSPIAMPLSPSQPLGQSASLAFPSEENTNATSSTEAPSRPCAAHRHRRHVERLARGRLDAHGKESRQVVDELATVLDGEPTHQAEIFEARCEPGQEGDESPARPPLGIKQDELRQLGSAGGEKVEEGLFRRFGRREEVYGIVIEAERESLQRAMGYQVLDRRDGDIGAVKIELLERQSAATPVSVTSLHFTSMTLTRCEKRAAIVSRIASLRKQELRTDQPCGAALHPSLITTSSPSCPSVRL